MRWDLMRISFSIAAAGLLLIIVSVRNSCAQQASVSIEVEINETLLTSQYIDLQSIIVQDGDGYELYRLFISNDSMQETVTDLYLSVEFHSEKVGLIFSRDQIDLQSFSLRPGQKVFVTSNTIQNGFPGIEEEIFFEGSFTPEGKKFYNNLKGLSSLPQDRYSLRFSLYQGNSRVNGGQQVATSSADFGINLVDLRNFYLIYPGDVLGYETEISNSYPNFVWQGDNSLTYRLIVVEAREDESAESLFGGAVSSRPIRVNGSAATGSLLEFEMLDVVLNQTNYQYPNSGVPSLEAGKTYYWQITSQFKAGDGQEDVKSEIWSFTVSDQAGDGQDSQLTGELVLILKKILGQQYDQLEESGADFQSIEIGGEVFQGAEALQALLRLGDQLDREEVSIVIEE